MASVFCSSIFSTYSYHHKWSGAGRTNCFSFWDLVYSGHVVTITNGAGSDRQDVRPAPFPLKGFCWSYLCSRLKNQSPIYGFHFLDLVCSVPVITITNGTGPNGQVFRPAPFSITIICSDLIWKTSCQFVAFVFCIPHVQKIPHTGDKESLDRCG